MRYCKYIFYEVQTPIFGRMGETPVGEGGRLMTALAEGELAQRFPHGKRVHSAKNSFSVQIWCESKKMKTKTLNGFCLKSGG